MEQIMAIVPMPSNLQNPDEDVLDKAFDAAEKEVNDGVAAPTNTEETAEETEEETTEEVGEETTEEAADETGEETEEESERTPPDEEELMTPEELDSLEDSGLSLQRVMEISKMPKPQRDAVLEFVQGEVARRGASDPTEPAKGELEVTLESIKDLVPNVPEKVIAKFAASLGLETDEVQELVDEIRLVTATPLIKATHGLVNLYNETQVQMDATWTRRSLRLLSRIR
jgi:hypothetical protein